MSSRRLVLRTGPVWPHMPRLWFWVVLHDTQQQLVAATKKMQRPVEDTCRGAVHPSHQIPVLDADGQLSWREPANGYAGLIRLTREFLTTEIVAHELVHATAVVYRVTVQAKISLGGGCRRNEEAFAYIHGDLAAGMAELLEQLEPSSPQAAGVGGTPTAGVGVRPPA